MSRQNIYLDYGAATPLDDDVLAAMRPYFAQRFYNPAAMYGPARLVKSAVDEAAAKIGGILGVKKGEIVFTSGGTESNNLAIQGIMQKYPGAEIIVSAIEHESAVKPAEKYQVKKAPVDKNGILNLQKLEALINDETVLVSVMHANNEVGSIQPLPKIAQIVKKIKLTRHKRGVDLPLIFHTDACQSANYLDIHAHRLGVDMMTLNGGKIYGPKQSGILYVRSGVELVPQVLGGGQQKGLRSGTESPAAAVGFAAALEIAQNQRVREAERLQNLQAEMTQLLKEKIPNVLINGSLKARLPNNVHITLPSYDNERVLMALDEAGVYAAAGSACSASSGEPSHVLAVIGLSNEEARSSLRFTLGRQTKADDVKAAVGTLAKIINQTKS